jgi:aerobic carbon-monoxide dehydrogenase medium subunit
MYPRAFRYHRAASLGEASQMLAQLGEGAKVLAGGQSLIPLMKLRFASPSDLVDLSFVRDANYIRETNGSLRIGALTRHADIEHSPLATKIPILHDCAKGIADVQVRNRGTIGGSLAEADPGGDWATVLMTVAADVQCVRGSAERRIPLGDFVKDAYTTALEQDELVREVNVPVLGKNSGGAYIAFKRAAPVYPTASAAVQLTLDAEKCTTVLIALGSIGLTPLRAKEAERALAGQNVTEKTVAAAVEAARAAAQPQSDMRGSAEYKRALVGALVKLAIEAAVERAKGRQVEVNHLYA